MTALEKPVLYAVKVAVSGGTPLIALENTRLE